MIIGISTVPSSEMHSDSKDSGAVIVGFLFLGGFALFWLLKTLFLGFKGNEIAWRSGRYTNVSQMRNVQRQWIAWSLIVFFVSSAVLITATIIAGSH